MACVLGQVVRCGEARASRPEPRRRGLAPRYVSATMLPMVGDESGDDVTLLRAVRVALDRERRAATRSWRWAALTLAGCVVVAVAAPVLVGVAALALGTVVFPAAKRQSTIRRLRRASDWTPATVAVTITGVGRGRRAHATVELVDGRVFGTNARRSSGWFPAHATLAHGFVTGREELLLTHDGRVYRLPAR